MERYFVKFVRANGTPGQRPYNFECYEEAIRFALDNMDCKRWMGWALYEVPEAWNWNIIPPQDTFIMLCMSPDWMKLI